MISITLSQGKNAELKAFEAIGHACFAGRGADIVCSAVSVLVRVAVLQLDEWAKDRQSLNVRASFHKKGNVNVVVLNYDETMLGSLVHLFSFLRFGFESIASEYPEHVCLKIEMC